VTKEVVHHAGLRVDGSLHLHLHVCKAIDPLLESWDLFHRVLNLVNLVTDVPLQRSILVRVSIKCRGSGLEARLRVTVRGVVTTTLMVTQVATPKPSVPLGLMRVSLCCSRSLLCCLHTSSPMSATWSYKVVARLSHQIKLQCKTFTRVQSKTRVR
jgi:hypothetical protein